MAKRTLEIVITGNSKGATTAVGQVQSHLGKLGSSAASTGKKIATVMGGAGLAGIAALGAGINFSIGEARESVKVTGETERVIKTMGNSAHVSAKQVGDLADSISKKTGIDDEAIQSSANLLLTFGNIKNAAGANNDIFSRSTAIVQDMSTVLGTDANSSAIQLGKALNDPTKGITALSRAGVSFTEQQKEQIRTLQASGDTLGAQKIIMAEVEKEFKGAAEEAATPWDKLKTTFANVAETLGLKLLPYIDLATTWLSDHLPGAVAKAEEWVGKLRDRIGELIEKISPWVAKAREIMENNPEPVFAALAVIVGGVLLLAVIGIVVAIASFIGIAGAVIGVIAAVVAGVVYAYQNFDTFRAIIDGVAAAAVTFWGYLQGAFTTGIAIVMGLWSMFGETILNTIIGVVSGIITYIQGFWMVLQGIFHLITSVLTGDWAGAWEAIKEIVNGAWTMIIGMFQTAWAYIHGLVSVALIVLQEILSLAWSGIQAGVGIAWGFITGVISGAWDGIKTVVGGAVGWIRDTALGIWDEIKDRAASALGGLKDIMGGIWDGINDAIHSGIKAGADLIDRMIRGVQNIINVLPGVDITLPQINFGDAAPSSGSKVGSQAHKAQAMASGGQAPINPRESGPFVTSGARAIVGEGSRVWPEYVIPTDPRYRGRAMGFLQAAAGKLGMANGGRVPYLAAGGNPLSDALGAVGGGIADVAGKVTGTLRKGAANAMFNGVEALINPLIGAIPWELPQGMVRKGMEILKEWISGEDGKLPDEVSTVVGGAVGAAIDYHGGGVEQWRGVALEALAAAGAPADWIGSLLRRMNQESGGNPNSVNNWDINAKNGVPSQGLMQVIPPTFARWAGPYAGRGIRDPFANIYAAIKYTISRYGSGPAGWNKSGGYALGGILPSYRSGAWRIAQDQVAQVHQDETILKKSEADQYRKQGGLSAGPAVTINVNGADVSADDVARAVAWEWRRRR